MSDGKIERVMKDMEGPVSSGHEQNVICQGPRLSMDRNHLLDPRPKIKRDKKPWKTGIPEGCHIY
eukprot:3767259-Karenia_brevis.AAC.1